MLNRPTLRRKFRAAGTRNLGSVRLLINRATPVKPLETARICRDPEDDKFLAAAQNGSAEYIVSEDKDLLDLGNHDGIRIVSSETFLRTLEDARR